MMFANGAVRGTARRNIARPIGRRVAAPSRTHATAAAPSPGGVVRREAVSKKERAALRAARRERAAAFLSQIQTGGEAAAASSPAERATAAAVAATSSSSPAAAAVSSSGPRIDATRLTWYAAVGVPTILIGWGVYDDQSPPAKISRWIGLTGQIESVTEGFARPARAKLIPDWDQMPNVPKDIPVPHTLVLDLENTLVSSTWDRKYGWRHAKRPGVDKFLNLMAQYYEIVLYSPSHEGIAQPVVDSLDKTGCIMHRLFRESTYYMNGVHVKDLASLNRPLKRMVVLDDDPDAVQLNRENLIRVKPYVDPNDREDDTLARITPLLIEIAREGYDDVPSVLRQFGSNADADAIADEYERRVDGLRSHREERSRHGLGALASAAAGGRRGLPPPELSPEPIRDAATPAQLTSKDLVGAPPPSEEENKGVIGWLNRRRKAQEEEQRHKMELWNEVMMRKQKERKEAEAAAAAQQ